MNIFLQRKVRLLSFILCGSFLLGGAEAAGDEQAQLRGALEKLRDNSEIKAKGMPGYRLTGGLRLTLHSKIYQGKYLYLWAGDGRWREEIDFDGYRRIRVGDEDHFWQVRGMEVEFPPVAEFDELVSLRGRLRFPPNTKFKPAGNENVEGNEAKCIKANTDSRETGYCYDDKTSELLKFEYSSRSSPIAWRYGWAEYARYQDWAGKKFPLSIRAFNDKQLIIEATFENLTAWTEIPKDAFATPPDATEWGACQDKPWKLKYKVQPLYPVASREAYEQGTVVLYGVIEPDGHVTNLRVIQSAAPLLDQSAMTAVAQWKYEQAACFNTKPRIETFIDVVFSLRR